MTEYGETEDGGVIALAVAELPGTERLLLWQVPVGEEEGPDGAAFLAGIRDRVAAGDREDLSSPRASRSS